MRRPLVLACVTLASVGSVFAQKPPGRATTAYGDWIIVCEMRGNAKVCEMAQSAHLKGQSQPITQIVISRLAKSGTLKVLFQVPINVWLPAGVKLATEHEQIAARFSHCVPTSCFAERNIKESTITALGGLQTNGELQFKDARQHNFAIPVSFKGLGEAYSALQK